MRASVGASFGHPLRIISQPHAADTSILFGVCAPERAELGGFLMRLFYEGDG